MTETDSCSGYLRMSGAEEGFGHLDFGSSILFRVSNFVLLIYRVKRERLQHLYGVHPHRSGPSVP
jgi:hypothetical protein